MYLPLLWDQSFCIRTPIALGYTRGHFSALVPMEPYTRMDAHPRRSATHGCNVTPDHTRTTFLPLMDRDRKLLPIHFLTESEVTVRCIVSIHVNLLIFSILAWSRRSHSSSMVRCVRNRKWHPSCPAVPT